MAFGKQFENATDKVDSLLSILKDVSPNTDNYFVSNLGVAPAATNPLHEWGVYNTARPTSVTGVIEGAELSELKFWVDDGDAKTEEGELRELSEFGIQKIAIPKKGELTSTTTATKEELLPPKS